MAAKPKTPLAISILSPLAEFANRRSGLILVESCVWRERPVDAGGASRGSTARAVPHSGARGKPRAPATRLNTALIPPLCPHAPLVFYAGGLDCPSGGVGQPLPSSRFASANPYPEYLAKLFTSPDFEVGLSIGRGRDDY